MKYLARVFLILFIFCLMSAGASVTNSTQEVFIYSVRSQKSITTHTLADYSDAETVPITNTLFSKELYVKNSETNLYLAFREVSNSSLKGLALFFDVDHDRVFANDVKILYSNQTKADGYYDQNSLLSLQPTPEFSGVIQPITYIDGKTYNLYQFDINFNPSNNPNFNPAKDMYIPDPSDYMLGFDLVEITTHGLISWSRGNLTAQSSIQSIQNVPSTASSFFTLVLAGPGKYQVPDFNPVAVTSNTISQTSANTAPPASNTNANITNGAKGSPGFELPILVIGLVGIIIIRKKFRKEGK